MDVFGTGGLAVVGLLALWGVLGARARRKLARDPVTKALTRVLK